MRSYFHFLFFVGFALSVLLTTPAEADCPEPSSKNLISEALFARGAQDNSNISFIKCLLDKGHNVNKATRNGRSILSIAISKAPFATVKLLHTAGARPLKADPSYLLVLSQRLSTHRDIKETLQITDYILSQNLDSLDKKPFLSAVKNENTRPYPAEQIKYQPTNFALVVGAVCASSAYSNGTWEWGLKNLKSHSGGKFRFNTDDKLYVKTRIKLAMAVEDNATVHSCTKLAASYFMTD